TLAHICPAHHQLHHGFTQKLGFVNADHFGAHVELGSDFRGAAHGVRVNARVVVGDNVIACVALVDDRLEDLHALAGDLPPPQTANQLFALAAEHRTANYLDPSQTAPHRVHLTSP